jgi:type IV secretion system protein VirB6
MFDQIYSMLSGEMSNVWTAHSRISEMLFAPLQTGMAINLIIVGFGIMRGIINEPWGAYLTTWFKAQLVIVAATSSFGPWLGSVAWGLPDLLAAAFGAVPMAGAFDVHIAEVSDAAFSLAQSAPKWSWLGDVDDWFALFLATVVSILAYLTAAIGLTMALVTKFSLAVIIAVGPIFVGALMFNSSSGMFFNWLGAALGAVLSSASVTAVYAFVSGTIWTLEASAAGDGRFQIYVGLIEMGIISIIGGYLLLQAPNIASIGGSGGASGGGLVSMMMPTNSMRQIGNYNRGKVGGAARAGAKAAAKGGAKAIGAAVGVMRMKGI